jgi:Ca2+-binding RTX toxin-like protein
MKGGQYIGCSVVVDSAGLQGERKGDVTVLRRVTLMVVLAAITVLVVAPAAQSDTIDCAKQKGKSCKGTFGSDWIFGSPGNDRILPMGGDDYVFGNGGNDDVAHSYDADLILGGCGSDTVRGGVGLDTIYANMPTTLTTLGPCPTITAELSDETIAAIKALDDQNQGNDVPDGYYDLVDCAWLSSRDDPEPDVGFGQLPGTDTVSDTVVDCSNRDVP